MSERPLPRSPLGLPPADPLGVPRPSPAPATQPQVRLAEVTNEWLSVISRQQQEQNHHLKRISGTLSAIAVLALILLILWLFGGILAAGANIQ